MESKKNKDKANNRKNKNKKIPIKVDKDKNPKNNINQYNIEFLDSSKIDNYDLNFKIIIIGNCGVGKTCITNKAIKNEYDEKYNNTIGMDIFSLFLKLDNKTIKLNIWDTCGQEIYRSLITNFYRNCSLAIIVYSIDDKQSFEDIDLWLKDLKINNCPDTKIILVGNKLDLEEKREVQYKEGKKLEKDYEFLDFFETSAKTGENIRKLFSKAASILYDEQIKYKEIYSNSSHNKSYGSFNYKKKSLKKHKTSECC